VRLGRNSQSDMHVGPTTVTPLRGRDSRDGNSERYSNAIWGMCHKQMSAVRQARGEQRESGGVRITALERWESGGVRRGMLPLRSRAVLSGLKNFGKHLMA
jgi:hypothetical protein